MHIGDVVILKCGSPIMVIDLIFQRAYCSNNIAKCVFFQKRDDGKYQSASIEVDVRTLQPYDVLAKLP